MKKTKNWQNLPSFEVAEGVLVQYSLVDNQYQQKSDILLRQINLMHIC